MENDIEEFSEKMWEALDANNKISLYVCYIDVKTGTTQDKLFNKNV